MLKRFRNQKGFTLIELLVVIAILVMIAGFALPRYLGVLSQAKSDTKDGDVALVQSAVDRFLFDYEKGNSGKNPKTDWPEELAATAPAVNTNVALLSANLVSSGYLKSAPATTLYIDLNFVVSNVADTDSTK